MCNWSRLSRINKPWDVGIYCTESGDFLVQVLSLDATSAEPPPSG